MSEQVKDYIAGITDRDKVERGGYGIDAPPYRGTQEES
jgi:hypothetical protein